MGTVRDGLHWLPTICSGFLGCWLLLGIFVFVFIFVCDTQGMCGDIHPFDMKSPSKNPVKTDRDWSIHNTVAVLVSFQASGWSVITFRPEEKPSVSDRPHSLVPIGCWGKGEVTAARLWVSIGRGVMKFSSFHSHLHYLFKSCVCAYLCVSIHVYMCTLRGPRFLVVVEARGQPHLSFPRCHLPSFSRQGLLLIPELPKKAVAHKPQGYSPVLRLQAHATPTFLSDEFIRWNSGAGDWILLTGIWGTCGDKISNIKKKFHLTEHMFLRTGNTDAGKQALDSSGWTGLREVIFEPASVF